MIWGNPPPFKPDPPKPGKLIQPEDLAGDSEHSQQVALFAWAALNISKYPPLAYMFAIPNGGARNDQTRMMLKAEGVRNGVCDIFLPWAIAKYKFAVIPYTENSYHGCFIEMKREKYRNHKDGGCSEDQIDFINHVIAAGYYCKVCYNWEEASDTLIAYLEGKL